MRQETQRARARHRRVFLAQRTGRGVARIGEDAFAGELLVQGREIGLGHIDLAAHLEHVGRLAVQHLGDVGDGADIGRHILADAAVAARRGLHQPPLLIAQRAGQAVDLGLGGERHLGIVG